MFDVVGGSAETGRVVTKLTEAGIAFIAEQTTHTTSIMAVIDG